MTKHFNQLHLLFKEEVRRGGLQVVGDKVSGGLYVLLVTLGRIADPQFDKI